MGLVLCRFCSSLLGNRCFLLLAPVTPVAVVAGEVLDVALATKYEYMVNYLIHEVAVVADDNHASLEVAQVLFKHLQGLYVKVVGRLVKH